MVSVTVNQASTWRRDAHVPDCLHLSSLDKTWSAERRCGIEIPGVPLILFRKVSNHLGLRLSPELEDHSWQDIGHCCCPSSVFPVGIKAVGILSSTPQSLIRYFCFFFSFFCRGRVLGLEGREECLPKEGIFCFVEHDLLLH